MKTYKIIGIFFGGLVLTCISCRDEGTSPTITGIEIGPKNINTLEAIGVELDPFFFSQNLTRNDGSKEADWEYVINRVKSMRLKKIRVMVLPQWFEPVNDNTDPYTTDMSKFTFESPEMHSLYKVLDIAQSQKIDVCIVNWGCPVYVNLLDQNYTFVKTCFMADPTKKDVWITGPNNFDEWAENNSVLIKYLVETKGYTCVNELTPINEPDGGALDETEYIKMVKILDSRFKKDCIRNKVRFNLSDNTDSRLFYLQACSASLSGEADIFNSHCYIFGYNTPNTTIENWEKRNVYVAAQAGKKHLVGEFGSNQCVGSTRQTDIDQYERGILMTRLVLNFLNAGACGVSYWSLIDQYYGKDESYEQMQQLGLWKYLKEAYKPDEDLYKNIQKDYEVRPQYYAYSLLTRFLTPGSEIYPIGLKREFVIGTALKDTEGKWTFVFANGSYKEERFEINHIVADSTFDCYVYEKKSLPKEDSMIEPFEQMNTKKGSMFITLKPQTVLLYRQK